MELARVIGTVVATRKVPGLEGVKLLLVEPLDENLEVAGGAIPFEGEVDGAAMFHVGRNLIAPGRWVDVASGTADVGSELAAPPATADVGSGGASPRSNHELLACDVASPPPLSHSPSRRAVFSTARRQNSLRLPNETRKV